MIKNAAGQKIGAQIVNTDGGAFTGSVTVYVTGDEGTQAIGAVGSGICTHKGNGYHTYAPSQSETNYDLVAFTFVGTGTVPVTIQVYTLDLVWIAANKRAALGLASANLDAQLSGISTKTNNLPADTNTLLTSTGIKTATVADKTGYALSSAGVQAIWDALTSALTAVGSVGKRIVDYLDAAISSRSTYAGGDTPGTTTLLGRIVGTLASGTHQPQSGDAFARHVPTEAEIAAQVRVELVDELASITAMEERLEEQVAAGPVVVLPAPGPGQTTAWAMCWDEYGVVEDGVDISVQLIKTESGSTADAFSGVVAVGTSDETGLATVLIPRGAGNVFQAWRGTGRRVKFNGVDAETLELPDLVGGA